MEFGGPFIQTVLTAGVGFCIGWYIRSTSAVKKAIISVPQLARGNMKLVLVVRNDLGMTKGKVAAQCSHATLGCYKDAMKTCPDIVSTWERWGQMKIVLKAPDLDTLSKLQEAADRAGLPNCLIHDAGHTQIPAGSATVLGIGPGESSLIDTITGDLKLY